MNGPVASSESSARQVTRHSDLAPLVDRFDPSIPIEQAWLPPGAWYTDPRMTPLDRDAVLRTNWLCAGPIDSLDKPGSYITGDTLGMSWMVVVGRDGTFRGFWNVCRHHASVLLDHAGCLKDEITCRYHGWRYRLDGSLSKAPRIGGIVGFERADFGLRPIAVTTWGRYVFVYLGDGPAPPQPSAQLLERTDSTGWRDLTFHSRRVFEVQCDWKVFVDNYLDGGYHIPTAHPGLNGELDPTAYRTETFDTFSLQTSTARSQGVAEGSRIDGDAFYAWLYPTLCINRYGDMMDVNIIEAAGPGHIRVIFDYFFDESAASSTKERIADALVLSEQIQHEDAWLSDRVQRGKASLGYDRGRYVPRVELAEHHFHKLLHADYRREIGDAVTAESG